MDFIVKLLKSDDPTTGVTYNSILVVVDRLTKYSYFISCNKTITAKELAHLVLNRIVRIHRLLQRLVTDRDKLFTSNY